MCHTREVSSIYREIIFVYIRKGTECWLSGRSTVSAPSQPGSIPQGENIKTEFPASSVKNAEGSFPLWPRIFVSIRQLMLD
jgi:hypothetical protein